MDNVANDQRKLRIYSLVFHKNALTLSTDNTHDDFWLELHETVGWVKFEKHHEESEFVKNGALFVATELRPVSDSAPYPIVEARCVLWRQREALLSAANTLSFLLGQERSGQ
ncbi:TPA: hypothetical protein QIE17_003521 [Morganella morganii subsp. morganii]|nr:hypothetical protein [Morganella morganii subsp. morganii]